MRAIDFLSDSPRSFIFNQKQNKNSFGGILSLIFLIIVLIISILYLVNYFINDKYVVEYGFFQDILDKNKTNELVNSEKYNPEIGIGFKVEDENQKYIDDDRILLLDENNQSLPIGFKTRVSKLNYTLLHKCEDKNCSNFKEKFLKLNLIFTGFKLDHQGETPLYLQTNIAYYLSTSFYFNNPSLKAYYWKIIKYNESLGFLDLFNKIFGIESNNEYIGGSFKDIETVSLVDAFGDEVLKPVEFNNSFYRILGVGMVMIDFNSYDQYKRKKVSFFDIVANICSLSLTIFNGFVFVFYNFYSKKYDNYEIIENIFSKNKINIDKNENINKDLKKENIIDGDASNSEDILANSNADEIDEGLIEKKEEKLILKGEEEKRTLPKIKFIDFIINSLPFNKSCSKSKSQALISSCNELITNSYSIEHLVYNQIMLENLLKDYKWNDPSMNKIEFNQFINEIKSNVE